MADEDKKPSLADKLRAQKAAHDEEKSPSLADKLKAAKEGRQEEAASLADQLQALHEKKDDKPASAGLSGAAALSALAGAAAGALSETDAAALKQKISDLQNRYREMPGRVKLTSLVQSLGTLNTQIKGFPQVIAEIRRQGYPYREYLEGKINVFGQQWDEINGAIKQWIQTEAAGLEAELNEVEPLVNKLNPAQMTTPQQNTALQVENRLEGLDAKIQAAENHIRGMYDSLQREVSQTQSQLDEVKRYLELKAQASFSFMAGESVYMVARAEWVNNNDNPDGHLFLTNQRIVFEQQEKTGKTLGLFGGKEVHQLLWETPLNTVAKAEAENKGLFGGKDMVHLSLGSGAPYPRITVEVKGGVDCKLWAAEIGRMVRGEVGASAVQADTELAERLRNAPADCPACGAILPRVAAGQNAITCTYCGTVVRI